MTFELDLDLLPRVRELFLYFPCGRSGTFFNPDLSSYSCLSVCLSVCPSVRPSIYHRTSILMHQPPLHPQQSMSRTQQSFWTASFQVLLNRPRMSVTQWLHPDTIQRASKQPLPESTRAHQDEIPERDATYNLIYLLIYHRTTTHLHFQNIFRSRPNAYLSHI